MEITKETQKSYTQDLINLKNSFIEIENKTIGLAKIKGKIEFILESNKNIFTTVSIDPLLGYSVNYHPTEGYKQCIHMFPKGVTLFTLKQNTLDFIFFMSKLK